MALYGEFLDNQFRRTHKWHQYFPVYERHFERFRNRHLTVLEIGVGEGGSVQCWRRYFGPFAIIVGIDINPLCRQVEEPQIHIRIGSQDDTEFLDSILAEFGDPDIVIDDGSHIQQHINATFNFLYPRVVKNGIYLVEDLHAAYWDDHGGGLRGKDSFIEHAKNCVDELHAEYTRGALARSRIGDRTTSVHFYDSIVVFEIGEYRSNKTNAHNLTGRADLWQPEWISSDNPETEVDADTRAQDGGEATSSSVVAAGLAPGLLDEQESQLSHGKQSLGEKRPGRFGKRLRKIVRRIKRS
jgi:hypothetical protein